MSARRSTEPVALPPRVSHGTPNAYRYYHCSCEDCRAAMRVINDNRRRSYYAQRVKRRGRWFSPIASEHGTNTAYATYGCRCWPCTAMHSRGV